MKKAFLLILLSLAMPSRALATWSVIAVDRSTGRVVIASATCVDRDDEFLIGVQAVVVPGKGVAACQAAVDNTHANQMLVFSELQKGTDPKQIIETAEQGSRVPEPPVRHRRSAGTRRRPLGARPTATSRRTSTARCRAPRSSIRFRATSCGRARSCRTRCRRSSRANGAITDRVMAAMEAADGSGGDSRCTCPPWPTDGTKPKIPCDEKTAHVAYILMAEKSDTNGDSHNNGKYTMYITRVAAGTDHGPNTIKRRRKPQPGEDASHALRRVAQDAAGVVQMSARRAISATLVGARISRVDLPSASRRAARAAARTARWPARRAAATGGDSRRRRQGAVAAAAAAAPCR